MRIDDPAWVESMLLLCTTKPQQQRGVERGSLWTGKRTGRRGTVLWAQDGQVCLSFSESNPNARVTLAESALLNNYTELK